jgi:hypothetical protein
VHNFDFTTADSAIGYFDIRWRFESDGALSAQDAADDAAITAVTDGAWYIDEVNVKWYKGVGDSGVFYDNFETGEQPGWDHADFEGADQIGYTFRRAYNPTTGRGFTCEAPAAAYMMVATHPVFNTLVDNEVAWIQSPVVDISDCNSLIMEEDSWFDFPDDANDFCGYYYAASDNPLCMDTWLNYYGNTVYYGGPRWDFNREYPYDKAVGNDYFKLAWTCGWLITSYTSGGGASFHMGGLYLDRVKVGKINVTNPPTSITLNSFYRFEDTFDPAAAAADSERVQITDADGIASAYIIYSTDGGETWNANAMEPMGTQNYYKGKTGVTEKGTEIFYYFEATDSLGYTITRPSNAPISYYEYSILPFVRDPNGILLVVGNDRIVLNDRQWQEFDFYAKDYWIEALETLGYSYKEDYDVFDIGVPGGSIHNEGPRDSLAVYHTTLWFTAHFKEYSMMEEDQVSLINWLESTESRDLLLCGDDIAEYLLDGPPEEQHDTLNFFQGYLFGDYPPAGDPTPGSLIDPDIYDTADTVVTLLNSTAGSGFIEDGSATLHGGCPRLRNYDKVEGFTGAARTTEYQSTKAGNPIYPAGTEAHATSGANTWDVVYLPYSFSTIRHRNDRTYMLRNILDFFGNAPGDTSVGVRGPAVDKGYTNALYSNYPNPFNPKTFIRFSIKEDGPVAVKVFNINGQLVRTLHDGDLTAGIYEMVWDGTGNDGATVANGVYFYTVEANGFQATKKMTVLK